MYQECIVSRRDVWRSKRYSETWNASHLFIPNWHNFQCIWLRHTKNRKLVFNAKFPRNSGRFFMLNRSVWRFVLSGQKQEGLQKISSESNTQISTVVPKRWYAVALFRFIYARIYQIIFLSISTSKQHSKS